MSLDRQVDLERRRNVAGQAFGPAEGEWDIAGAEQTVVGNLVGNWIDSWEVLRLPIDGRVTVTTDTYGLESVNDVRAGLRDGEVVGRAVLVP